MMEYSGSRISSQRMSVGLLLLLALVTGAVGSRHSHRKLLQSVVQPLPPQIPPPAPPPPTSGSPPPPNPPENRIPGADPPLFDPVTWPPPPPTAQLTPPTTTTGAAAAPGTRTWNESEKAGVEIAAIAGMLQVAVFAFLLVKRRQMLAAVDYEDLDDEDYDHHSDHVNHNYRRHPEHSA